MNNDIFQNFDILSQGIAQLGEKWKEEAEKNHGENSYAGIANRMKNTNFFLNNERRDVHSKLNEMKDVLSPKLIEKKRAELLKQFDETTKIMVDATRSEISKLTAERKAKIGKMLSTAPTDEQNRLLSVLQMRNDIDATELNSIFPAFFGNYQAMRVLQDIGKKNGINVNLPVQLDPRTLFETVDNADAFLKGACNEIAKPYRDIDIKYHPFYTVNKEDEGKQYDPDYEKIIAALDSVPQLQDVKADKTQLTATEKARIDHYFSDVAGLDTADTSNDIKILTHTKAVMEAHPNEIGLLKLSQYAKYVSDVEEAQAAEKSA